MIKDEPIELDFLTSTTQAVHLFPCFAPHMALLGFFIERIVFLHNVNDLPPYAATGIQTQVRELHLFEGP